MSEKVFRRILITIAIVTCVGLIICSKTANAEKQIQSNSELSLISSTADGVVLEFYPSKPGVLEVELCQLEGKLLAKVTKRHQGKKTKAELFAQINTKDMANYYIKYRFAANEKFRKRSLMHVGEIIETIVLGQKEYIAGSTPLIRILVKDKAAGIPVAGAAVAVELTDKDKVISMFTAKTDSSGQVGAKLYMPDEEIKSAKLKITVTSKTAKDKIEETIKIVSPLKTLLTTDKPLYQPGQTIHIRALTLAKSNKKPAADSDLTFEVEDSKGNKVFKKLGKTDKFGISHTDFVLGTELNMGTYRIRAIVAGMKEEKTVNVEKYVLPKFKVNLKTDRNFYQPGETVKGDIQVDYFFGKPVSAGKVEIKCSKFDVAYQDFQVIEGKTDETGHYSFTVTLPKHFVGQPLEAGKASTKFQIKVTDTADHAEKLTKNVSVTANPIIIAAVPESGELIADLENKIYIVTTYADSTPASCKVIWKNPGTGKPVDVQTDAAGFAEVTIDTKKHKINTMSLSASDVKGNKGTANITLKTKTKVDDDTVLVRTDKSLYKAGEKIDMTVVSTRKNGTAYIDFIKNGQTYLTRTLDLEDGTAKDSLTADNTLSGTVQVNAYVIGANGVIVRDRRLVIIDPANDLNIDISSDKDTYLPAANAKIKFKVTGKNGKGIASALGVMVVDEAVFALQEMQPGLEKVYFYLEKEIAKPRYEIHGYDLSGCVIPPKPIPLPELKKMQTRRDTAAKVLLASAKGAGDYPLHVNTYINNNKSQAFQVKMAQVLAKRYQKVSGALNNFAKKHKKLLQKRLDKGIDISVLINEGFLTETDSLDPWGTKMKLSGSWCKSCQNYHGHILSSAGIDGKWGTTDDCSVPAYNIHPRTGRRRPMAFGRGGAFFGEDKAKKMDFALEAAMPMPALEMENAAGVMDNFSVLGKDKSGSASAKPAGPRIRQYFPETLYFNPALITAPDGTAALNIPLADSITTWRMSCMASSMTGQLGSTTAGINVFQDFFVDIDFPVALTQNDEVSVPVAIYNYLKKDQQIELEVKTADWFELKTLPKKTITLAPSEITVAYFPIIAKKIGHQKFTVIARGSKKSDAVARTVEIVPDGKENLVSFSGRLEGDTTHTITIPDNAIADASKIFVKVYPGVLSQIAEGLDKILRMPGGCFEQTSSTTYPNILVLDYMKSTGKITPELQMKAEGFINNGYQRLLSFEVKGGGFEWFGRAPAHRILTAYGLMEFYDMSKVFDVDPAVISRTQQWLAKCQEKDGSYKPSKGGIAEGAINKFTDDIFRNTAYITWALASTGYDGPEIAKGIKYLTDHLDDMKDVYTIALTANAFSTVDPKSGITADVIKALMSKRKEEGDIVNWSLTSATPTHGTGKSGDIEVTGLAVQALMRSGRESGTVTKAVNFLVKSKDAFGTWQSTQATIQALKGMLMAESAGSAGANATIAVEINGKDAARIEVNDDNSDLLQLVDLKDQTANGNNNITLKFKGEGSLLYQVVGRYYMPYKTTVVKPKDPMTITVDYDRTKLVTDDIINVTATVENNRPATAKMIIVDLGLPPGFTLIPDKLNKMVKDKTIEKYSTTGRQIIVYIRELSKEKPLKIQYQLLAKYPLKAKTAKSTVYEYYNPEIKNEAAPIELTVANQKE